MAKSRNKKKLFTVITLLTGFIMFVCIQHRKCAKNNVRTVRMETKFWFLKKVFINLGIDLRDKVK